MTPAAVYRNRHSHCCIVINEDKSYVQYISTEEGNGEIKTDIHKMQAREFHSDFKELDTYPVLRAVEHYLNPLTTAIAITDRAAKALNQLRTDKGTAMNDKAKMTRAERNVEATRNASIKNTGSKPEVGPVVVVEKVPGASKKATKGTWDKKVSPTEDNRDATKQAIRKHNEAKAKAAKKAAQKAARLESKKMTEATESKDEATNVQEAAPAAAKPAKKTAAKKAAPKKAATPAVTKPAEKAKKENTVKTNDKKAPAKKTAKTAAKKAPAKKAAPKKLAKGTGKKSAAPAKKAAGKAKSADGGRRGRKGAFEESQKIKVLVKDNPKREGTESYNTFELLKKSKTVGDFFASGGGSHNLHWNIERGYIEVN